MSVPNECSHIRSSDTIRSHAEQAWTNCACLVQSSPALHKLRILGWPELDPCNQEILRKAAPWLRLITIEVDNDSETEKAAQAKEDAGLRVLAGMINMAPRACDKDRRHESQCREGQAGLRKL